MLSLSSPLWLLGLLGVPVIRWLHRFSAADRTVAVAALFLWRSSAAAPPGGRKPGTPDPRWRLRALVLAALALALAGPRLETARPPVVDVWIDDSLSMQTVEHGHTRLGTAFARLDDALFRQANAGAVLHSLTHPAEQRPWRRDAPGHGHDPWLVPDPSAVPRPPPAALMARGHLHWLITDGADAALNGWAAAVPLSRVIRIGDGADNVAVTRLAARPDLDSPGGVRILIGVDNTGPRSQTRTVSLYAGDTLQDRQSLRLAPHGRRDLYVALPSAVPQPLRAVLTPGDALAADDSLSLAATGASPMPVSVDKTCPMPLMTALRAHPRLRVTAAPDRRDKLRVVCSPDKGTGDIPALRIHAQHDPEKLEDKPSWSTPDGSIAWPSLQRGWLYADAAPAPPPGTVPLLETGRTPLITASQTTLRVIDVYLDLTRPIFVRQPAYLALIDGLITAATGRTLLDETFSAARPAAESRIAPLPSARPLGAAAAPPAAAATADLSPAVALLAALLLALDLLLVARTPAGDRAMEVTS